MPECLAYRGVVGTFVWSLLWLLTVPFLFGVMGEAILALLWCLAYRKQFRYDHERRVFSWVEGGHPRTYSYSDCQTEQARWA